MATLTDIEGIGAAHAERLEAAGIHTTDELLLAGATRQARTALAEKTGIGEDMILEWGNHADLYRIKGVASEYADLLEAAGVDSVVELAQRNATNLHDRLVVLNEEKHLVRAVPTETQIAGWLEEARGLERAVHH
jgi:predicted flap endonuclease-1-like 5' DNA nuclease